MLVYMFKSLLITSLIGLAATLVLALLRPFTKKFFSSVWHYYMWLVVLVVMILPVRISLPEQTQVISAIEKVDVSKEEAVIYNEIQQAEQESELNTEQVYLTDDGTDKPSVYIQENLYAVSVVWLLGVVILFAIKLMGYILFILRLHSCSSVTYSVDLSKYTDKRIAVRTSDKISSPLMTGVFKPTLLLPETAMDEEQLNNVLAHEMIHFKRKDILLKWFVSIVKCIHWFNPAVYYISRQADIECEISCDLAVVKGMSKEQEAKYISTILALISAGNRRTVALTMGMTSDKKTLKRRFVMIKKRKIMKKSTRIVSMVFAAVLLITTLFVSGVLATTVFEEESNILFIVNGKTIELDSKPFYENKTVYLPLREILNKVGIMNNKNSSLEWNNGRIILKLSYDDEVSSYDDNGNENGTKTRTLNYCYAIEIGKAWYILNPEDALPFTTTNPVYKEYFNTKIDLENAPILKENITYVPYEYIDHFLGISMAGLGPLGVDGPYDITCIADTESPVAYVTPCFFWPANTKIHGTISREFGTRVHPVTGEQKIHNGVDIIAKENSDVVTAIRGKVTDVGYDDELGNYVVVENESGVSTLYAHLASVEVKEGDYLHKRANIGKVGKSGTATGAFLHFEIKINGVYYDPMKFWVENSVNDIEAINNDELLQDDSQSDNSEIEWNNSTQVITDSANSASIGGALSKSTENNTGIKIKSTEVGDEPYTGFEHLVLKNADTNIIMLELNKQGIVETNKSSVDLTKHYVVKDYSSEQTKVESDKNGNISLYFSVNSDNLFDVHFYDVETGEDVGSYRVLANNENAYTFIGFEKGKTYNVEVQCQTKDDWVIEGNYIIY